MKKFKVLVRHDDGKIEFRVVARNYEAAILMVMESQGCPRSAIEYALPVLSKSQEKKAKNMLRGL